MSLIKSVVKANDEMLVAAHRDFQTWKSANSTRKINDFHCALKHFSRCARHITKTCTTFTSGKSYARAIATTYVVGKKVYWKPLGDNGWKNVEKTRLQLQGTAQLSECCLSATRMWCTKLAIKTSAIVGAYSMANVIPGQTTWR